MSENKNILKELGIDENLNFETQMIMLIFYIFNGNINIEKIKQVCKECGFEKYIKDIKQ